MYYAILNCTVKLLVHHPLPTAQSLGTVWVVPSDCLALHISGYEAYQFVHHFLLIHGNDV